MDRALRSDRWAWTNLINSSLLVIADVQHVLAADPRHLLELDHVAALVDAVA